MTDTTALHPVSTSLPDDLFERFEDERRREDRNISQHLRTIVRRYYERIDADAKVMKSATPIVARPFQSPQPWPGRSMTVTDDPHRPEQ